MSGAVLNVRTLGHPSTWPADVVYVGRNVARAGLRASPFANPYTVPDVPARAADGRLWSRDERAEHQARARLRVLEEYAKMLRARPDLVARARAELAGKRLACWCAPLACHADVLARVAAGGEP